MTAIFITQNLSIDLEDIIIGWLILMMILLSLCLAAIGWWIGSDK